MICVAVAEMLKAVDNMLSDCRPYSNLINLDRLMNEYLPTDGNFKIMSQVDRIDFWRLVSNM